MDREKIVIVGVGELGGIVLELLARVPNICEIVVGDNNEDWGFRKTNSAVLGASYMGLYPKITFKKMDLFNVGETAAIFREVNPTIIYNGTTLQSWWVVGVLPQELLAKLYTGLGPWLPMHLTLAANLMRAVKEAGIDPYVLNSSFPDAVNPVLGKVGLAPTVGIGNMDLIIPAVRKTVAEKMGVPLRDIGVNMIAHHYHAYHFPRHGTGTEAPFYLRIFIGQEDVTDRFDMKTLIADVPRHALRPAGAAGQFVVASSSLKNIMAIYDDTGEITHAPGPDGLLGGYMVRLSRKGAEVVLPPGLSLEEAIRMNEEAQRYDGIEKIYDDGTVRYTEKSWSTMKDLLGYDCLEMRIEESASRAKELREKFSAFCTKHGINAD